MDKKIAGTALFLSLVGFVDSFYLTVEHYGGVPVNCVIFSGCDKILSSEYSTIFGIPIALMGMAYYLFIFSAVIFFLSGHRRDFLKAALFVTPAGFLMSLWSLALQFIIVKSLCLYCLIAVFSSMGLFLTATFFFFKTRNQNE